MARTKKKEMSPEERRQIQYNEILRQSEWLPKPTYRFENGEGVELGNLDNVVVVESFEDGMFYEIDFSSTDNNYGNPITSHHNRRFVSWLEIRPFSKPDHGLIKNEDLQLHYSQRQLEGLLGNLYHFRTNMNPAYQRGYVWELEDKVALIDSIFNNIDIGKFVFVHMNYGDEYLYEILDGKQRLNAISAFYENVFQYEGLFYNDLSRHEKYQFKNYPISYAELRDLSEQQKLRYFLTLNRTGKSMSPDHLTKIEKMLEKK